MLPFGAPSAQGPAGASAAATASIQAGDGRGDDGSGQTALDPQAQASPSSFAKNQAQDSLGAPGVATESSRLSTGALSLATLSGSLGGRARVVKKCVGSLPRRPRAAQARPKLVEETTSGLHRPRPEALA